MAPERRTDIGNFWKNDKLGITQEKNMGKWAHMYPDSEVKPATTCGVGGKDTEHDVTIVGEDLILTNHVLVVDNGRLSAFDRKWVKIK
jgi:hypothetical protein